MGMTRSAIFLRDNPGCLLPMPAVTCGDYLVEEFKNIGCVGYGANGEEVLSFSELSAYSQVVSQLSPNEVRLLRQMSLAYISGLKEGKDEFSLPPWR
jgi:hypothetical protein